MTLHLMPTSAPKMPETLASVSDTLLRDAADHPDQPEYVQVLHEASECARRLREIATSCMRPAVVNDVAEQIEQAMWPMESEIMRWDDDRAGRVAGNRLDNSRAWHPRELER